MKIDAALAHCNVMHIYFDHRHVHIARNLFPPAYFLFYFIIFFFFEGDNCNTHYLFNFGSFHFFGKPTAKPDFKREKKKTFLNVKRDYSGIHHVWRRQHNRFM